jgi:hypothetical protein
MELSWSFLKEFFFAVGSLAGVFAFMRPVLDSKFKRDQERAERIKQLLTEDQVIGIEPAITHSRMIHADFFAPFAHLNSDFRVNADAVRFSGPLRKYYLTELRRMLIAYRELRNRVQVPWWNPTVLRYDGIDENYWQFDRSQFFKHGEEVLDYAKHLDEACKCSDDIRIAYQRFQIVCEMHLLEAPLAFYLLPRRFAAHGLRVPKGPVGDLNGGY